MARLTRRLFVIVLLLLAGVLLWNRIGGRGWTRNEVRDAIVTTLQTEAPASFYVTGELEVTATVTSSDTKYLVPAPFLLNLGTTEVTVRVPGLVSYGFDVRELNSDEIAIAEDGWVEVVLPELSIYSIDPDMARLEMQTKVGWARTHAGSGNEQQKAALKRVRDALRLQAERHLQDSAQPGLNTVRALEVMLLPVLTSLGMDNPRIRVRIGDQMVLDPQG